MVCRTGKPSDTDLTPFPLKGHCACYVCGCVYRCVMDEMVPVCWGVYPNIRM